MSKPSGQSTQTAQINSTTGPPAWAQQAGVDLFGQSDQVAQALKPTSIAQVAPLTAGQNSLFGQLMGNVGASNPAYAGAQGTLTGLQGFRAPTITPQTLAGTDLNPYMNPFTESVIDTSMAKGRQGLAQGLNQTADSAIGAGAFGGSRHGVREGVAVNQFGMDSANLAAQLNAANFAQAQGAAGTDIGNDLAAQSQNAGNSLAGAGVNLAAANGAANVAGQQQQSYLNSLFAALMGQNQIQGQQQAQNQYAADTANASNILPSQQLALRQGVLNGVPMAQTTNGTQTTTKQEPSNGLMQTLGGILGLAGSVAGIGGPSGFGAWGKA